MKSFTYSVMIYLQTLPLRLEHNPSGAMGYVKLGRCVGYHGCQRQIGRNRTQSGVSESQSSRSNGHILVYGSFRFLLWRRQQKRSNKPDAQHDAQGDKHQVVIPSHFKCISSPNRHGGSK